MPLMQFKPLHAAVLAVGVAAGAATVAWSDATRQWMPAAHAQTVATAPAAAPLVTGLPDFTQLVMR